MWIVLPGHSSEYLYNFSQSEYIVAMVCILISRYTQTIQMHSGINRQRFLLSLVLVENLVLQMIFIKWAFPDAVRKEMRDVDKWGIYFAFDTTIKFEKQNSVFKIYTCNMSGSSYKWLITDSCRDIFGTSFKLDKRNRNIRYMYMN